jgi:predicted dehydrogenase
MLCRYRGGALALLSCAVRTQTSQEARISGTAGSIHIPGFWHATTATLQVYGEEPVQTVGPAGYHYEAAETMSCLRAGKTESSVMPLDESIAIARTLDRVRASVGLAYAADIERRTA